jgi:hypothetical protein
MLYYGGLEKRLWRYVLNYTGSQYGPVVDPCGQWWNCWKNIIHHRVIKRNVGSGSSQSAHILIMYVRPFKFSMGSWLQWHISMGWCQHQLHRSTNRLPILSNVCICKHKHNDKLTSQPYTDTCTSCSRQTTTFRQVNILTYCTFLQFLSTLHHPDWSMLSGPTTLRKSWKVNEETWTMLGQSICYPQWDVKM